MKQIKSLIICIFIYILLIGCSKPIESECKNITINNTIETIKYIDVIVKEPCNLTYPVDRLELIRRIKFLEGQQDKWIINETRCIGNDTTCIGKLEMAERDIEELEDDLENCTRELCNNWNSSWCD